MSDRFSGSIGSPESARSDESDSPTRDGKTLLAILELTKIQLSTP